jgi:hypothetical protein
MLWSCATVACFVALQLHNKVAFFCSVAAQLHSRQKKATATTLPSRRRLLLFLFSYSTKKKQQNNSAAKQVLQCNVAFFVMLRYNAAPQEQTLLVELRCSAAPQTNK